MPERIIVDSNLKMVMNRLDFLQRKLVLSDKLKKKSLQIYQNTVEQNIIKGRPIDSMMAAIVYVACRDSDVSHTLNDITKTTGLRKNSIAKCIILFSRISIYRCLYLISINVC